MIGSIVLGLLLASWNVVLTWDASDGNAVGYYVYYSAVPNITSPSCLPDRCTKLDAGNQLTYTVSGLSDGQVWYMWVTAYGNVNVDGVPTPTESPSSNVVTVALNKAPIAPQNLKAKTVNQTISPNNARQGIRLGTAPKK